VPPINRFIGTLFKSLQQLSFFLLISASLARLLVSWMIRTLLSGGYGCSSGRHPRLNAAAGSVRNPRSGVGAGDVPVLTVTSIEMQPTRARLLRVSSRTSRCRRARASDGQIPRDGSHSQQTPPISLGRRWLVERSCEWLLLRRHPGLAVKIGTTQYILKATITFLNQTLCPRNGIVATTGDPIIRRV